jgi:hypothetical protein
MALPELTLTGTPSTDATRIVQFADEVPETSNHFDQELYFELQDNYSGYYEIKKVLEKAESKGVSLQSSASGLAKSIAENPFDDVMENRSRKAKIADRSTTATNLTRDFSEWAAEPNRHDYPGVDTLSEQYRADRIEDAAETAEERGVTREITVRDQLYGGEAAGEFSQFNTEIMIAADQDDSHRNLAHELGHALDFAATDNTEDEQGATFGSEKAFAQADPEQKEKAAEELQNIWDERGRDKPLMQNDYLEDPRELAADFAALAIEDPQRAQNRAPNAQEVFDDAGILDTLLSRGDIDGSAEEVPEEQRMPTPDEFEFENRREDVFNTSEMKEFEELPFFTS